MRTWIAVPSFIFFADLTILVLQQAITSKSVPRPCLIINLWAWAVHVARVRVACAGPHTCIIPRTLNLPPGRTCQAWIYALAISGIMPVTIQLVLAENKVHARWIWTCSGLVFGRLSMIDCDVMRYDKIFLHQNVHTSWWSLPVHRDGERLSSVCNSSHRDSHRSMTAAYSLWLWIQSPDLQELVQFLRSTWQ